MKFNELNLSSKTLDALNKMGFSKVSEVQVQAIPAIMDKRHVIAQAQTGTGKTAAFGIPLIENTDANNQLQHLILAPARELAVQIYEELKRIAYGRNIHIVSIIGGISYTLQERNLKRGANIIVATPGRFMDNFDRGLIDVSKLKTFTLDEADEMLNFGFYKDIVKIYETLPQNVQTLFFTATFDKRTKELAQKITKDPVEVKISTGMKASETIDQKFIFLKEREKLTVLVNLLQMINPRAAIIFGRTKRRVDELTTALSQLGFKVVGIQGDMRQRERSLAMANFREGKINILVGTDVMARGIDVENVDYVFNFDLPTEMEYYTHRIGRTGRAEKKGTAISFVKEPEIAYFRGIMTETNSLYEEWPKPTEDDLKDVKMKEAEISSQHLLRAHTEEHIALGARISSQYSPREMGIIIASLLLRKTKITDATQHMLTPEQAAGQTKKLRDKSRGDQKSRNYASKRREGSATNKKRW